MITIKKITLIFTFCLLPFSFLFGQDTWTKTYNPFCEEYVPGMGWIELEVDYEVEDVLVTQDSGYVVSGSFDRWIDDDPPFWFDHWGFLMKTDCDGNLLWAKGDSVDFLGVNDNYAFVETDEGDLISVGYQLTGGGYMIKRDSEGNRLWAIPYDDFGVNSMERTVDDNIILGGRLYADIALRKIDNDGNTIWTNSIQIGTGSNAYSIYSASNGNYLLTGVNYTAQDILVVKTDSNGDSLWTRTFEGLGEHDQGNCIIETDDGNILVGGVIGAPAPVYGYGFLSYLYPNGDTLWTKYTPGSVLGPFQSLCEYLSEIIAYGGSNGDAKMIKLDYSGNITFEKLIYGNRPNGNRCFHKIGGGYIFISRPGLYDYRIALTRTDNNGNFLSIDDNPQFVNEIINAYPNPFYSSLNIQYMLPYQMRDCTITIYNIKGELVNQLQLSKDNSLSGNKTWDGKAFNGEEVQNGIYFLKLEDDNYTTVIKVTKIK